MFNKTPEINVNIKDLKVTSPFRRKKRDTGSESPNASFVSSEFQMDASPSFLEPSSIPLNKINPLKTIKKITGKKSDEVDTRDLHPASPNLNFGSDSQKMPSYSRSGLKPSNFSSVFKSTENLSAGLEDMPFGIYELQKYGIVGNIHTLAFDPLQSLMAVITEFNQVYIFGQSRVQVTFPLESISPIRSLRFIKGIYLIAVDSTSTIYVISLLRKKVIHKCIAKVPITAFACDYSLEFVYVGLKNGMVRAFNIESGMDTVLSLREQQTTVFRGEPNVEVTALNIHPRDIGTLLISYPKATVIYNLVDNTILNTLVYKIPETAPGGENSMYEYTKDGFYYPKTIHNLWHPNGLHCLTVYSDNSIVFWDAKTGQKILARTLFDVEVDEPTGKHQKISKNRMTKIKTIRWIADKDPEKNSLLILGGDGYPADGYHQLVRMDFGKMLSYSITSYKQMAQYYAQPKEQRIFALHSKADILNFIPLGEASPYFDGCHGVGLVAVIMGDGSLKFLSYPQGQMSLHAKYFPSSISWLNPKITCSSSSYVDRRLLNTITVIKNPNEMPESILKGGIPCRPKFKADVGSLIITGHENGFIRLWDSSEGQLDSSRIFEIDIAEILQKDDDGVTVENVSFAPEALEIVCCLRNGDVLLFAYQVNKKYQPKSDSLALGVNSLKLADSGRALIDISDRTSTAVKRGFLPKLLIKPLQNGSVTAICASNLGLVAIGYESGRFLVIDRHSGTVVHNEIMKDDGLGIPMRVTCITFGYGLHSGSVDTARILMYVGTSIGRLLTYEVSGLPGTFRTKYIEKIDSNDEAIDSIIVVNSQTGRPTIVTIEHTKRSFSNEKSFPYVITASKSDIRVVKNNSKIAHKSYGKGNVSKIGITGAKAPRMNSVAFCLVVVLGGSKILLCLTIPSLMEISNLRIPYRMDPVYARESYVLPLGDVFLRINQTEAALTNIMKLRKPVMSLETKQSDDTLFLKNITVPWRPEVNPMLKSTPSVTYSQLYTLLTNKEKPTRIGSEEGELSWEVSCYNPANYTYITTAKPIYYNPNALHQDALLMETPKRNTLKKRHNKDGGWLNSVSKKFSSSLENAQDNFDAYVGDLNDGFDQMVSDAKNDAIKGIIGSKFG